MSASLDKFGAFVVQKLHDPMHNQLELILNGKAKSPSVLDLQNSVVALGDAEKDIIRAVADLIIQGGLHDLLFALQEEADSGGSIDMLVDGLAVATESDGMHGEIYGERGWIARFSKFKRPGAQANASAANPQRRL